MGLACRFMGVCLGHQVLGLAAGARTSRLPFGHHGANHPVREVRTGRVTITSQNHTFQVEARPPAGERLLRQPHQPLGRQRGGAGARSLPAFSVQFHPEARPAPKTTVPVRSLRRGREAALVRARRATGACGIVASASPIACSSRDIVCKRVTRWGGAQASSAARSKHDGGGDGHGRDTNRRTGHRRSDWRVLLVVFTLTGVIESQAFGHLNAFRPLYLQQFRRAARRDSHLDRHPRLARLRHRPATASILGRLGRPL